MGAVTAKNRGTRWSKFELRALDNERIAWATSPCGVLADCKGLPHRLLARDDHEIFLARQWFVRTLLARHGQCSHGARARFD